MNTRATLLIGVAIAIGIPPSHGQTGPAPIRVAENFTPAASRLGAVAFEDLNALAAEQPASQPVAGTSRIGSVTVAQIPTQPVPGQNPNTIRPLTRPPVNPKRPLPTAGKGTAGSPGPTVAPVAKPPPAPVGGAIATPAPPVPPPSSPIAAKPATPPPSPIPSGNGNGANGDEEMVELQYPNMPMPQLLLIYEDLTGLKVIKDINVEAVTFSIETTGKMPKSQAIEFMEKSFLLAGYVFVPAGEGFVKFINAGGIKIAPEFPPIFSLEKLNKVAEQVVTFIQPLQYLDPDDLQKTLQTLVPLHAYGIIQPLPNSRGIVITENANTIRYILALLKEMDVEPSRTEKRTFQLVRSNAEDVAKALADILDLEGKGSSSGKSGGGGVKAPATPQPAVQPAGIPNQPGAAAAAPHAAASGVYGAAPQAASTPPKLIPIARTNKLLVIARPVDLDMIGALVEELDGATDVRNFVSRPLRYLDAGNVLQILSDALSRLIGDTGDGKSGGTVAGGTGGTGQNQNQTTSGGFPRNQMNNQFGSQLGNQFGGQTGGFGGGSGGMGFSGGQAQPLRRNEDVQSLVLGKSLLIADPTQNAIFVSGPPDHLEVVKMILDEIDVRPKAVVINAVIGTMGLDNNEQTGIDYIFNPQEIRFNKSLGNIAGSANTGGSSFIDPSSSTFLKDIAAAGSGLSLFGTFNDQVSVALKALRASSNFTTLSRPSVYTLNNQPATIFTGTQVPVPTSTLGGYGQVGNINNGVNTGQFQTNIQYQSVNLSLSVAPLILNDDEIKLNIQQENNSLGDTTTIGGNPIPQILSQGLTTTVLVKNNATVLLGGLISESTNKSRNGIPLLKDIPLIKFIFSSTTEKKNRKELLIFLNPRIVTSDSDLPPNHQDSVGASNLGELSQQFFQIEHSDPGIEHKTVRRTKLGQLLQKLFN